MRLDFGRRLAARRGERHRGDGDEYNGTWKTERRTSVMGDAQVVRGGKQLDLPVLNLVSFTRG